MYNMMMTMKEKKRKKCKQQVKCQVWQVCDFVVSLWMESRGGMRSKGLLSGKGSADGRLMTRELDMLGEPK